MWRSSQSLAASCTLTLVSEILLYVEVENVIVRLNAEDCIIKSYLAAGLLTFDI